MCYVKQYTINDSGHWVAILDPCEDCMGLASDVSEPQRKAAWRAIERSDEADSGCWEFGGARDAKGYGKIWAGGKTRQAHRLTAATMLGLAYDAVPGSLVTMHDCHNPACCRPSHLRFGTHVENMNDDAPGLERNRTHCPRGHRLAGANLKPSKAARGKRECLVCARARTTVHVARRRGITLDLGEAIAHQLTKYPDVARDALSLDTDNAN